MRYKDVTGVVGIAGLTSYVDNTPPIVNPGTVDVAELAEEVARISAWQQQQQQSGTNNNGVIDTDEEVRNFLSGMPEGSNLKEELDGGLTDEDLLSEFGYKPGDVDLDDM